MLIFLAFKQMLTSNVQPISSLSFLFISLKVGTDIIDILISYKPIELILILPSKLRLLTQQLRDEIVFFHQLLSQNYQLIFELLITSCQSFLIYFFCFHASEQSSFVVLLLVIPLGIFLVGTIQKRTDVSTSIMRYFSLRSAVPQLLLSILHFPQQIFPQNALHCFSNIHRYRYHLLLFRPFYCTFSLFQEPYLFAASFFNLILLLHGHIDESNEILDGNFLSNFSGFSTIISRSLPLGVL